jgi:hypothetical protein
MRRVTGTPQPSSRSVRASKHQDRAKCHQAPVPDQANALAQPFASLCSFELAYSQVKLLDLVSRSRQQLCNLMPAFIGEIRLALT